MISGHTELCIEYLKPNIRSCLVNLSRPSSKSRLVRTSWQNDFKKNLVWFRLTSPAVCLCISVPTIPPMHSPLCTPTRQLARCCSHCSTMVFGDVKFNEQKTWAAKPPHLLLPVPRPFVCLLHLGKVVNRAINYELDFAFRGRRHWCFSTVPILWSALRRKQLHCPETALLVHSKGHFQTKTHHTEWRVFEGQRCFGLGTCKHLQTRKTRNTQRWRHDERMTHGAEPDRQCKHRQRSPPSEIDLAVGP